MTSKQAIFETVADHSDAVRLYPRLNLFLKPSARILITVQLSGKSKSTVSNWQIMERLKEWIDPDKFSYLCLAKTSSEFIKFNAELADRTRLSTVLSRLCNRRIKFHGISHLLTVNANEILPDFPTRHDWNSYFRDNKDMDELKPGERPDTLHITNIPREWLIKPGEKCPSEKTLKKIFKVFGEVARVDLPATDPSRVNYGVGICDAYIQFKDYSAFEKAMDTLRGNKLAYITETKALIANIKVDFDKTKHMSLSSIKKRNERRDRFLMRMKEMEEIENRNKEKEIKEQEKENNKKQLELNKKLERRKFREEKRKAKRLKHLADREADEMNQRIVTEEKLLLKTQRKLEAIHLLGELFTRIKENICKTDMDEKSQTNYNKSNDILFKDIESTFRRKMIEKWKLLQPKTFKNFHYNNDQNVNNNRGRGRGNWRGNRGKGTYQCINRGSYFMPPVFDPMQLINYGHKYHKYFEKFNKISEKNRSRSRSRSRKQKRSLSTRSTRSYSFSRSHSKNYNRSRSRSQTNSIRSRSHSKNNRYSSNENVKENHSKNHSRSRSLSRSRKRSRSRSNSLNKHLKKIKENHTRNTKSKSHKKIIERHSRSNSRSRSHSRSRNRLRSLSYSSNSRHSRSESPKKVKENHSKSHSKNSRSKSLKKIKENHSKSHSRNSRSKSLKNLKENHSISYSRSRSHSKNKNKNCLRSKSYSRNNRHSKSGSHKKNHSRSRSHSRNRSISKNSRYSRSKSLKKVKENHSLSHSRSRSHSKNRSISRNSRNSRSKSLKKIKENHLKSRSKSKSKIEISEKLTENSPGVKYKKKSKKNKKSKKTKKDKK